MKAGSCQRFDASGYCVVLTRLLFALYLHENWTNEIGKRILKPLDPIPNM